MNNVIIGLGGTGGKVINRLKHKLYGKDNLSVDYLYIDSNFDLVNRDTHLWQVFGDDISLEESNKYQLTSEHLKGAFDFEYGQIHPRYSPWAGKIEDWKDMQIQLQSGEGAIFGNQRRRMGRMLLSGHINNILDRVNFITQGLTTKTANNKVTFHICVGLSGGTGSGGFIDILAKLKANYSSENNRFILYLVLPEDNPDSKRLNGGNYFANVYASLKELNALYTGNWIPYDISLSNTKIELPQGTGFVALTYLLSNKNEANCLLDMESMQVEEMIADFLQLRLSNGAYGGSLSGIENAGARQAENENGRHIRSRDFFTFGIKRVIYPKDEIAQYMVYKILYRISLALRFNQWTEDRGYIEVERIQNINLLTDNLLKEFKITPDFLLLKNGVLDNENGWQSFEEEWGLYIQKFAQNALDNQNLSKKDVVNRLLLECAEKYNSRYRQLGVNDFFGNAQRQITERVDYIIRNIQNYLIHNWLQGHISLPQIEMVITEILSILNNQRTKFIESHNRVDEKINASRQELSHWKSDLEKSYLFKSKAYVNSLNALKEHYIYKTYNEAYVYGNSFIDILINRIQNLQQSYNQLLGTFIEFSQELESGYYKALTQNSNNDSIEKIYNKSVVDELLDNHILNNRDRMNLFKNTIESTISEENNFVDIANLFEKRDFMLNLQRGVHKEITDTVQAIANLQPNFDISNKNIIKELENRYGNNPTELKKYMNLQLNKSGVYLPFNATQINEIPDNERIHSPINKGRLVLHPQIENEPFINDVLGALNRENQTVNTRSDNLVNELTLVEVQPIFPLRYIQDMQKLSREYNNRYKNMISPSEIDVKIHLEGSSKEYSDVLLPSLGEMQEKSIPSLFILDGLGLIEENEQLGLHVNIYQSDTLIDRIELGKDFIIAHRHLGSVQNALRLDEILRENLLDIQKLIHKSKEEKKLEVIEGITKRYKKIEQFYKEQDLTKIPFWGRQCNIAINRVKEL